MKHKIKLYKIILLQLLRDKGNLLHLNIFHLQKTSFQIMPTTF